MGATDTASGTFSGELPPYATNTEAKVDGSKIVLTWDGDSIEWAIIHNGEVIDTTTSNSYSHSPTMEGEHRYNVIPVIDGQQIQCFADALLPLWGIFVPVAGGQDVFELGPGFLYLQQDTTDDTTNQSRVKQQQWCQSHLVEANATAHKFHDRLNN